MAPDIEELIKKVNTLTLDKTRLRQKLIQLGHNGCQQTSTSSSNHQSPLSSSQSNNQLQQCSAETSDIGGESLNNANKSSNQGAALSTTKLSLNNSTPNSIYAGVECSTSCEEDLLFINELYRKRLDEYNENWDYIQSKCTALLSELNSLQKHYSLLKKEKLDLEEKFNSKCDEHDKVKSELQTVVLNYEAQLSAMSDHLSMITSQVNLVDDLERVQQSHG